MRSLVLLFADVPRQPIQGILSKVIHAGLIFLVKG